MRLRSALFVAFFVASAHASPPHLKVRGSARIDGHAGRSRTNLLVEGRIVDDAGTPVPSASFVTTISKGGQPIAFAATGCSTAQTEAPKQSDESGRFCMWVPLGVDTYEVHVTVPATELLAAATVDYNVDLAKRSIELRFDPEPRIFSLDAPPATLDVVATYDDIGTFGGDAQPAGAVGLELALTNEVGAEIARGTTRAGGRGSFTFNPKQLGPPGRGALKVRFAGGEDTMPSEHAAPIERDARVTLTLAKDLSPALPEDGFTIEVLAQASVGSAPPVGNVEARLDSVLVGAAPLDQGRAALHVVFVAPPHVHGVTVQLRYVPSVAWFHAAAELPAVVPIRGPSPWRQVPLVVGAVLVAAWLMLGRTAKRRRDKTIVMTRPPLHEGTAGISVVRSSRSRAGIYAGRVIDAHDGTPIAQARLAVEVPSFQGSDVVASVFTDEAGEFRFDIAQAPPEAMLAVEGPLHAELRQRLPNAGVLEIALVLRRRRILERFVQWAKRRGPPFDARPEPTPAQVRRAAGTDHAATAAWADAVERAAFDVGDVDARIEADIAALEPDAPKKPEPRQPR